MKNREEILSQDYISPKDIKYLVPELGIDRCREIIDISRLEMKEKGYYVPNSKPKLALTKIVKKILGI